MGLIAHPLALLRSIWQREGKLAFLRRLLGPALMVSYHRWSGDREPTAAQLAQQRVDAQALPYRPLVTVLISADGTPPALLDGSIRSVVDQSYDRWELRVTTGPAPSPGRDLAGAWHGREARIHIEQAGANLGAARRGEGGGEFVAFLGAGDVLAPHALFEVARLLNEHPGAEVVYFDEDVLSAAGPRRSSPSFRPDWSPELLLSVNYLAHAVIKRTLLDEPGSPAAAGGAPWDLTLRCAERAREIRHIPKVLYHVRAGPRTTQPPRPEDLRALEHHCRRLGIANPRAAIVPPGVVRITWPTRDHKVSIIIPNKNQLPLLRRCVTSLLVRTTYPHFEILIVDTGSTDAELRQYYASLASEPRVRIIEHPGPFNYSAANNAGARAAAGDLLLFLNNDTEPLDPDWLEELVRWAERQQIGAVGAKLLYPANHTIQHAGVVIGLYGLAGHIYRHVGETHTGVFGSVDWYRNYLAVTGACMMVRREVFEQAGGFDETYQVAFSDVELCLRIHARGYRVVYTPFARLRHHEGATRGSYYPSSDTRRAIEHMRGLVAAGDPYFHPGLSHESPVPMLPRRGDRPREVLLKRYIARASTMVNGGSRC